MDFCFSLSITFKTIVFEMTKANVLIFYKRNIKFLLNFLLIFFMIPGSAEDRKLTNLGANLVIKLLKIMTKTVLNFSAKCSEPKMNNIKLYLYARNISQNPIELNFIKPYQVNTDKKVIVLIHGYISKAQNHELLDLKNAYLEKYDCNVIMVDWKKYAWALYTTVVCVLPKIANLLGHFLCILSKEKQYKLRNIHLVGHSLGAQMSGLTGQAVKAKCEQQIGRITGLDPAGPLFLGRDTDERLDSSDAEFVDAIHTNGGVFGYLTNIGHADFYPNCGTMQFCQPFSLSLKAIFTFPLSIISCHHGMSLRYMSDSIRKNMFKGIPCNYCHIPFACPLLLNLFSSNNPVMGEKCPYTTRGSYFVFTLLR